jgi:hypothetical protein
MLDVFSGNIMRISCCFRIERKQNQTGNRPKSKKIAKTSKSIPAKTAPFLAVPTEVPTAQRMRSSCLGISHFAVTTIPTAHAGIVAFILGVGRFGVVVERPLQ